MTLLVKWRRERFHLTLPPPDTKLTALRQYISELTHLPLGQFKIIYRGGIMKDDTATLSAFGVVDGSTIHVVGSEELVPQAAPSNLVADKSHRTEVNMIAAVHNELSSVNLSIRPSLESFMAALAAPSESVPDDFDFEHKRLGELLLQCLLRLDALVPEGQWTDARLERKKAVKDIQFLLDSLDSAWRTARQGQEALQ